MYSKELLKGTLKTIVLHLLSEEGRMYGYQINQQVQERSDGQLTLTEGALYPALHKLEAQGLLKTEVELVNGRKRKYYKLTASGKKAASKSIQEFAAFVNSMKTVLSSKSNPDIAFS